jgi:hypothetical protein
VGEEIAVRCGYHLLLELIEVRHRDQRLLGVVRGVRFGAQLVDLDAERDKRHADERHHNQRREEQPETESAHHVHIIIL